MSLLLFLEALLGVTLLALSIGIFSRASWLARFAQPIPSSFAGRVSVALALAVPGAAVLAATSVPFLAFFASSMSFIVMAALAVVARITGARVASAAIIAGLAVTIGVAAMQPLGLKVLLLPKADKLPYEPVPWTIVKTYEPGVWFEGVSAASDGTLYLSANRGLDFTIGKYYRRAQGQVIARKPDGSEHILFTTPPGSTAGVIAIAGDGSLYMTSNGDQPGVWRISPDGTARKLTELPGGAWPNGLDFGPDGMLYSPDSSLGQVWRVDPRTGRAEVALRDRKLSARPLISLAPGANGLHFVGNDMIVTVSDSTEVLRYHLRDDHRFSPAVLVARGIPGDDFAVGPDGSLFITTHPYDTLVRVAPDGRRTIVADQRQQVIGATDAVFGRAAEDRDTLYVATDGGAFTGGPQTRGALIALKPYTGT